MNITTLLLFGSGIWGLGLETLNPSLTPEIEVSPVETQWQDRLDLSATSVIVTDTESMAPVFEKNSNTQLPMASITKVMTALVIMNHYENELNTIVTITKASQFTEGSSMKLKEGEQLTLLDLLYGLLIKSGNDAAIALAHYHSGTVYDFVSEMNKTALELGLKNTHFNNPHGLDSEDHYSTAQDIAVLAKVFIQHPILQKISSTRGVTITSQDGEHEHFLENTNKLLGQGFSVSGIKTGTTENAGQCLLLFVHGQKKDYFIVILGSEDRYQDAKTILFRILGNEILMKES